MYAHINLPGSRHFRWFGPASRNACEAWLAHTAESMLRTEQLSATLPQRIVSNKEAESWRYRDGTKVVRPGDTDTGLTLAQEAILGATCPACQGWARHQGVCVNRQGLVKPDFAIKAQQWQQNGCPLDGGYIYLRGGDQ